LYKSRKRLRGVYIPYFDQISVKNFNFGVLYLIVAPMGVKFGVDKGTEASTPNFTSSMQRVAPMGQKNSKSASEQFKYRRVALRAMLPLKTRPKDVLPNTHRMQGR